MAEDRSSGPGRKQQIAFAGAIGALAGAALTAPLGRAAGRLTGAGPLAVGTVTGAAVGALGVRPQKVALGPLVGAAVGLGFAARRRDPAHASAPASVVAWTTVIAYRTVAALLFRDAQVSLLAETGPWSPVPSVRPASR